VQETLHNLIPPLFIKLCRAVEILQATILKAKAQLENILNEKKTLDMASILEADLTSQKIVAPENMEELVNSLVDLKMVSQNKKTKKLYSKRCKRNLQEGPAPPNPLPESKTMAAHKKETQGKFPLGDPPPLLRQSGKNNTDQLTRTETTRS
jgi:hypothetical protein